MQNLVEKETPIVNCIERIYELTHGGKRLRIKSTKSISSEEDSNGSIFVKERDELLKFINEYEILEINTISTHPPEHSEPILIESPREETEASLPKEEDVINYITSKELFEHDTIELQEKFLGKRLQVRDDRKLFNSFDNILRRARKYIANKHNVDWDTTERKSYSNRIHVIIYKVKKATEEPILSDTPNNLQVQKLISLGDYKRKEPETIQL